MNRVPAELQPNWENECGLFDNVDNYQAHKVPILLLMWSQDSNEHHY